MTDSSGQVDEHPDEEAAEPAGEEAVDAHLQGVEDGDGCTEIWERLSEHRSDDDGE